MHLAYKCDVCDISFKTKKECLAHENEHKDLINAIKKIPSKFNVGDIVIFQSSLLVIQYKKMKKNKDNEFEWHYEVNEPHSSPWYIPESNVELCISVSDVQSMLNDFQSIAKKYHKNLSFNREDYEIDGSPCFELVFNKENSNEEH